MRPRRAARCTCRATGFAFSANCKALPDWRSRSTAWRPWQSAIPPPHGNFESFFYLIEGGNEVIPYTFDGTRDYHDPIADKPLPAVPAAGIDAVRAENARLREALTKIHGEAMRANATPEVAWYRIAGIAARALAHEESCARANTVC